MILHDSSINIQTCKIIVIYIKIGCWIFSLVQGCIHVSTGHNQKIIFYQKNRIEQWTQIIILW